MRGKSYSIGEKAGVLDEKHIEAMGPSRWLFSWAIRRQTGKTPEGLGVVMYGNTITYEFIQHDIGQPERTLRRWMKRLVLAGYLKVRRSRNGFKIFIAKEKKFKDSGYLSDGQTGPSSAGATPEIPNLRTAKNGRSTTAKNGRSRNDAESGRSEAQVPSTQSTTSMNGHSEAEIMNGQKWPFTNGRSCLDAAETKPVEGAEKTLQLYSTLALLKESNKEQLSPFRLPIPETEQQTPEPEPPTTAKLEPSTVEQKLKQQALECEIGKVARDHGLDEPENMRDRRSLMKRQAEQIAKRYPPTGTAQVH